MHATWTTARVEFPAYMKAGRSTRNPQDNRSPEDRARSSGDERTQGQGTKAGKAAATKLRTGQYEERTVGKSEKEQGL